MTWVGIFPVSVFADSAIHDAPASDAKPSTIRTPDRPATMPPLAKVRIASGPLASGVEITAQTPSPICSSLAHGSAATTLPAGRAAKRDQIPEGTAVPPS